MQVTPQTPAGIIVDDMPPDDKTDKSPKQYQVLWSHYEE